jgi:RecA-family ATPase
VQWSNACRQRLYLSRVTARKGEDDDGAAEVNPDVRQLEVKKANWGPTDQKINLRWKRGVFVVYNPLDDDDDDGWKFGDVAQALKEEDEFLRMLDMTPYPVSAEPTARNNAPKLFADDQRCKLRGKAGKITLKAAMERLLTKCVIIVRDYGRPSRPNSRIERAPQ